MPRCHLALRGDDVATAQGGLVRLHKRLFAQFTARFMQCACAAPWPIVGQIAPVPAECLAPSFVRLV